jgi:hypothetical protein
VPITITTAKAVDRREAYVRVIFKPESLQQGEADEEPGAKVGCMPLSPPPASSMCRIFAVISKATTSALVMKLRRRPTGDTGTATGAALPDPGRLEAEDLHLGPHAAAQADVAGRLEGHLGGGPMLLILTTLGD